MSMESALARRPEAPARPAPAARPSSVAAERGSAAGLPVFLRGSAPAAPGVDAEAARVLRTESPASIVEHASTCSCGGTCARCRAAKALAPGAP
ncbi:MAG TPA: hypothetical protein VFR81_02650 [Longimicrobium sp.]|nr:hypothetical protein [Longimicrobium sp.]